MASNPEYHFTLQAGVGGQSKTVYPLYDSNAAIEIQRESGQQFFRTKLAGKLKFIREDYDFIMAQSFDTQFELTISRNAFFMSAPRWTQCQFSMTDCSVNEDGRTIEVQPLTKDDYADVMAGMDKEFNLIKLAPKIERIMLRKRPLVQIYNVGDPTISCFLGGMSWEQDCQEVYDTAELTNKYHFRLYRSITATSIVVSGTATPVEAKGVYIGENGRYNNSNGYYIKAIIEDPNDEYSSYTYQIFTPSGVCRFIAQVDQSAFNDPTGVEMTFYAQAGATGVLTGQAESSNYALYARYLHDVVDKGAAIPADDIVENNRNYRYASPYNVSDAITVSHNISTEPTEWGMATDGYYFAPPTAIAGQRYYPVAQSSWLGVSLWFSFNPLDQDIEREYRKAYVLRDSYPVSSVISVLLREIAPNIAHEDTEEYSKFLYGESDPIAGRQFRVSLTQKTNILRGDYQVPAQKAPITLKQVLDMLCNTFRCYWYIENGMLKIEHLAYFVNGGSYNGVPTIGTDLTALINPRNGKSWAFATSSYTFDKLDAPSRYKFAWADDVTSEFEGRPIEVLANYVEKEREEEITIANMVSDVDYMMLAPEQFSEDGFAVMATVKANAIDQSPSGVSFVEAKDGLSPKWTLHPECRAMNGVLTFRMWGGGSAYVVIFDEDNKELWRSQILLANNEAQKLEIYVPAKATSIAFLAVGSINATISALRVDRMRELPFVEYRIDGVDYTLQNGYMAFSVLQPSYWLYNMPARNLRVNGENMQAASVKRIKTHSVSFPAGRYGVDPKKNVRTFVGIGSVEKISLSLLSNIAETTLKYVPE